MILRIRVCGSFGGMAQKVELRRTISKLLSNIFFQKVPATVPMMLFVKR